MNQKTDLDRLKAVLKVTIKTRLKKIEKNKKSVCDTLLIGDSIIEYYRDFEYLSDIVINNGMAGCSTKDIADNFEDLTKNYNPKNIVVHIGTNDMVLLTSNLNEVVLNILNVLKKLNNKFPKANIFLLSLTPVLNNDNQKAKSFYLQNRNNQQIDYVNSQLKKKYQNYIEINSVLKDGNDELEEWYTTDGIHLNEHGYKEVSRILKVLL